MYSFAKPPVVKDQIVVSDLRQCLLDRAPRCLGQDHIIEAQSRNNRPGQLTRAGEVSDRTQERVSRHKAR